MLSLGSHSFLDDHLQWFAAASGDYNPIHVDPFSARRLISGEQVVHGMKIVLTALKYYYQKNTHVPERIQAYFPKPIFIGEEVHFFVENINNETRISVRNSYEELASIRLLGNGLKITADILTMRPEKLEPESYNFSELKGLSGRTPVMAVLEDLDSYFPHATHMLAIYPVAALMAFSRIVGMKAPGLHSLFTGLDVKFGEPSNTLLSWSVVRHKSSFAPIQVEVAAEGIRAALDVFVRPAPMAQAGMIDVVQAVNDDSFVGQRALVIGGSRGLGEVVAKCVSAGGGSALITYASGEIEALGVRDAITQQGGACEIVQLDVNQLGSLAKITNTFQPTHIYYFASGPLRNNLKSYNTDYYDLYAAIYVHSFSAIVRQLATKTGHPIHIFYPSTVFVDDMPDGFDEYVDAKLAGERACRILEAENSNLEILIKRLPMLKTDQTASLIPVAAKPALPVILQVVREMNDLRSS